MKRAVRLFAAVFCVSLMLIGGTGLFAEGAPGDPVQAQSASGYFLKIAGIEGESQDVGHRGEIDIMSWSWGASNPVTVGATGGASAGKVQFQDFHFTKRTDSSSPSLMLACAMGQHIPEATLTVSSGGETPFDYLKITLSDVLITSYQIGGSGELPTESISLNFTKIEMSYTKQRADGTAGETFKAGYDLAKAKKV